MLILILSSYFDSEVHELREEMTVSDTLVQKEAIISELGDILFDTLMLEMLLRKEYNFGCHEAWDAAATKVERRTPYMREWGDGITTAETVEEAETIWQNVKKKEKHNLQKQLESEKYHTGDFTSKTNEMEDHSTEMKPTERSIHNSSIFLRFQPLTAMISTNLAKALNDQSVYLCAGFIFGYFLGHRTNKK